MAVPRWGSSRQVWRNSRRQKLEQRVAPQTEAKRFERDDLLGMNVAEVDVGPLVLD